MTPRDNLMCHQRCKDEKVFFFLFHFIFFEGRDIWVGKGAGRGGGWGWRLEAILNLANKLKQYSICQNVTFEVFFLKANSVLYNDNKKHVVYSNFEWDKKKRFKN